MATLTIGLSGSGIVNGSKSFTIDDAGTQALLDWATVNYATALSSNPTNGQVLIAWVNGWVTATKNSVQQFKTVPSAVPPLINVSS